MKKYISLFVVFALIFYAQISYSDDMEVVADNSDSAAMHTSTLEDSLIAIINTSFERVKPIIEYSCYDCHSSNTKEPWYFNIPGLNSWLSGHVEHGRKHLDFTNGFPFKTKETQVAALYELKEEVEEGEMPIFSYRIMHWGRLIEDEKQDTLFQWIDETIKLLNEHNYTK